MHLFIEALVVGVILLLVSVPIMGVVHTCFADYGHDKYYIATILIGMITHFVFEYSGVNAWYCNKGWACLNEEEERKRSEEIEVDWG